MENCKDCKHESENCFVNCCEYGNHEYSDHECPDCGHTFCYSCCAGFWRNMGENGYNLTQCPNCSHKFEV